MIRCDMGIIKIEGNQSLIKAELSTIIFALKQDEVLTIEDINEAVNKGIETKEEDIKNLPDEFIDKLKKILDIIKED